MSEDIAAAVDAARRRAFVGRDAEVACFRSALAGSTQQRVLFVHGVGGLGKTALLQRFRAEAQDLHVPVVSIDAETVGADPAVIRAEVEAARPPGGPDRSAWVLLIDAYERLAAIDTWIRTRLVASLPAGAVVVIAGRLPPSTGWLADLGWRSILTPLPLAPLSRDQSVELLRRADTPSPVRGRLADLGQGHPLTLAMLANGARQGAVPEELADAPDLVSALASQLVDQVPDDDHALAVALCAHAWLTTQDLIDELLGRPAPELWVWLEAQPWVTRGTYGSYPHDLVRDVLAANLRRRSPETFDRIHRFVHARAWTGIHAADAGERRLWSHQKLFLHHNSPLAAAFWTLRTQGSLVVAQGQPDDHAAVVSLVRRDQGPDEAALAQRWLSAQPDGLAVARSADGLEAFHFNAVCPPDELPVADDEVAGAALRHADRTAPARPGELICIGRFLGGRTGGQRDPHAVVVASVSSTLLWTSRPLAWSFVCTDDPEFWDPAVAYLALGRILLPPIAGTGYTMYAIDWRRLTPEHWFELMGEREVTGESGPPPEHLASPAPLPRAAFAEAVRSALRGLGRPDGLAGNPLLGSRLVAGGAGPATRQLHDVIVAAVAELGDDARSAPASRVLDRTFVHAALTQERAAEVLDLPFSTYRRRLARGIDALVDLLWSIEIGQRPGSDRTVR